MFRKMKEKVGAIVKHNKKKMSLFLALGMIALTQSSAFAGDIIARGDDGSYSFSVKPLIDDLMSVFMGVVNNGVDLFVLGVTVWLIFKLVKKIAFKSS